MSLRLGKHPAKNDYRTLRFANYITSDLPTPPQSYNVLERVYQELGLDNPTVLFPMDGNDRYGDCTIAALAHAITVYNGMIGKKNIPDPQAILKLYFNLTGGSDSGLPELDVLNSWQSYPALGEQILAFAKIDVKNHTHIQQAINLFGGVYLGFQVTEDCQNQFEMKQPWTPGSLINEGHAVFAVEYDQTGVTVLTWGNTQKGTWEWWDECVDEAYAILPPEAKASDFDPGFNFNQLMDDLQKVAN